jgi:uncharacterized membrane protein YeaQ/YmgE (transglycosylase-associated protein family)
LTNATRIFAERSDEQALHQQPKWRPPMFSILWEVIIGLIVGAFAKLLMPGKDPGGIWITIALGIAGSILATYLGQLLGWYQPGQTAGFIMSIAGAILLLFIYRVVRGMLTKS